MDPGILTLSRMNVKHSGIKLWSHVKLVTWTFLLWQSSFEIGMHKDVPLWYQGPDVLRIIAFALNKDLKLQDANIFASRKPQVESVCPCLYLPDKTDTELQTKPKYKKMYSQMSYSFVPLSVPLSLTHTALSITNSGNSRPAKMWQGHIRQWGVDRQGWQSKNHAPRFNGWPDEDALLPTLRPPSLTDLPLTPCCCEQPWPTKPSVARSVTQHHHKDNQFRDRGKTYWEKRGKEQKLK